MKFLEKLEQLQKNAKHGTRPKAEEVQAHREALVAKRQATQSRRGAARLEKLSEEDRLLASTLRVPRDREGRVKMAQGLFEAAGRTRSQVEVAAIMGVAKATVNEWVNHPEGLSVRSKGRLPREPRQPSPPRDKTAEIPEFKENFGDRLARRRRTLKWSKAELARRLGVSVEQVTEWEQSRLRPAPTAYRRIMDMLDS